MMAELSSQDRGHMAREAKSCHSLVLYRKSLQPLFQITALTNLAVGWNHLVRFYNAAAWGPSSEIQM